MISEEQLQAHAEDCAEQQWKRNTGEDHKVEIDYLIFQSTGGSTRLWLKPARWWHLRRRWMHRKICRMFGSGDGVV